MTGVLTRGRDTRDAHVPRRKAMGRQSEKAAFCKPERGLRRN